MAVPSFCHLLDTNYEIGTLIWLPSLRVAEMKSQDGQMCHVPCAKRNDVSFLYHVTQEYCKEVYEMATRSISIPSVILNCVCYLHLF